MLITEVIKRRKHEAQRKEEEERMSREFSVQGRRQKEEAETTEYSGKQMEDFT